MTIHCSLVSWAIAVVILTSLPTACSAGRATGALLAYEPFDYPAPGTLANKNGGRGWGSAWDLEWGGDWTAAREGGAAYIVADKLADPVVASSGNFVVVDGNTRAVRMLDVRSGGVFDKAGLVEAGRIGKAGTTLYVGFTQDVSVVPVAQDGDPAFLRFYGVEFNTSNSEATRVLEIGYDDRTTAPYYGAASVVNNNRPDKEPGQFQSLGPQDTKQNVIVVRFTFGAGDNDVVEIFRNPESATDESASTVDARLTGDFRFDRIALARFTGQSPTHRVDEIRFGTQYTDVFKLVDEEMSQRSSPRERAAALQSLKLSLILQNNGLAADKLLFVKRHMFKPSHIYTEYVDGPYRPGGGLFVLSPVRPDGKVTMLFDAKGGICRDPDVSFDAKRVLFSYRQSEEGFCYIYEMNVDGTGLRQLTDGPFHDMDPFYLPDGRIGFTSTRCKSRVLCFWVSAATLFVMDADGSNARPLTANNVNEFTPDLLSDGRILYTRWEYMDKSAIFVQSLWSILPDGTRAQQVFGNNLIHPVSLLQGCAVPGTKKIACILGRHNGDSVGPLAIVDPMLGVNNPDGILNLTPEGRYHVGCFSPCPLNSRWCVVSYGPTEPFAIYLFGIEPPPESISVRKPQDHEPSGQWPKNPEQCWSTAATERYLIYRDNRFSCVEAIPIAPRSVPPVAASTLVATDKQFATLVLADVYQGLDRAVPRGQIKYLRVVEEMGERNEMGRRHYQGPFTRDEFFRAHGSDFDFKQLYAAPWEHYSTPAPSLQAKHVYGTVPVEPDGSAHFLVPAERPIYFQALDEDYNEIQRMRSYIHLKPGERQSCIGCHEPRNTAPPSGIATLPMALRREPSRIEPPPFGAGPFSYQRVVQPVLDKHCAGCHATNKPVGGVDLSACRDSRGVPASFATLVRRRTNPARPPLVNFFDNWWGVSTTVPVAKPLSFGAAVSRLIEMIDTQHEGVQISPAERQRIQLTPVERRAITTWIDLNCPLWDNYSPGLHARNEPPR